MAQNHYAVGRFRFQAPTLLQPTGQSSSIYRVDVHVVPMPWGGSPRAFWETEIRRLRSYPSPSGPRDATIGGVELRPGIRGVWCIPNPESPDLHELLGIRFTDNSAVFAVRSCDASKHSIVETLVGNVLAAYVPGTAVGFCVGPSGAVVSDPGTNESASLTLASPGDRSHEIELRVETMTVAEPDLHTYSNLDEERSYMTSAGGRLQVLREGPRVAAGLGGKEIAILLQAGKEPPMLRYTWHYSGESVNAIRPRIDVIATAPVPMRGPLEEAWERVLTTLSPVPSTAAGAK